MKPENILVTGGGTVELALTYPDDLYLWPLYSGPCSGRPSAVSIPVDMRVSGCIFEMVFRQEPSVQTPKLELSTVLDLIRLPLSSAFPQGSDSQPFMTSLPNLYLQKFLYYNS